MVILVCFLAFALAYVSVPTVIGLSWRIGAVDVPRDWRRMHPKPIPRAGGIAIYSSFLIAGIVLGRPSSLLSCALGGGFLLLCVGLADDIFCLRAWSKFFFQIAAVTASVLGSGLTDGWRSLGAILWVLTLTNAHNFIDGLDGLFAGTAVIEGSALCLAFLLLGMNDVALLSLLLALSCLAFRAYNAFPARIFAGDCGSGTVGFLLGMLSLSFFEHVTFSGSRLAPLLIFAYPLTDLITAVLRRVMHGKSPFAADRGHLHHRICDAGLTQIQCGRVLLLISFALAVAGVLTVMEGFLLVASLACAFSALLLIRIRRYILNFD